MKTSMHDLGKSPSMGDTPEKAKKYYPSARVPLAAIKGAPTDGSEFTATVKVCVRSVDNRDDAADIEIKGIALASPGSKEGPKDSGEGKSRVPRRTLAESLERTKASPSEKGEDY